MHEKSAGGAIHGGAKAGPTEDNLAPGVDSSLFQQPFDISKTQHKAETHGVENPLTHRPGWTIRSICPEFAGTPFAD